MLTLQIDNWIKCNVNIINFYYDEISFITNNKDIIIKKNEVDEQFLRQANGVYPDAPQFVKCFKTESYT